MVEVMMVVVGQSDRPCAPLSDSPPYPSSVAPFPPHLPLHPTHLRSARLGGFRRYTATVSRVEKSSVLSTSQSPHSACSSGRLTCAVILPFLSDRNLHLSGSERN